MCLAQRVRSLVLRSVAPHRCIHRVIQTTCRFPWDQANHKRIFHLMALRLTEKGPRGLDLYHCMDSLGVLLLNH